MQRWVTKNELADAYGQTRRNIDRLIAKMRGAGCLTDAIKRADCARHDSYLYDVEIVGAWLALTRDMPFPAQFRVHASGGLAATREQAKIAELG